MAEVGRRDPLGRFAAAMAAAARPDARLAPAPAVALVSLRLPENRIAEAGAALGAALPETGRVTPAPLGSILGAGPDEWLVLGNDGDQTRIEAALRALVGARPGAVVDLSASRAVLTLTGPGARDVLATCVALDFHPTRFGPGRCAETLLAKAPILIEQLDDAPSYRILVRPSYAGYVVDWLVDGLIGTRATD